MEESIHVCLHIETLLELVHHIIDVLLEVRPTVNLSVLHTSVCLREDSRLIEIITSTLRRRVGGGCGSHDDFTANGPVSIHWVVSVCLTAQSLTLFELVAIEDVLAQATRRPLDA